MRVRRYDILNLPLVPASERLTVNLLADPVTPEPRSIVSVPDSSPSLVRRSRPVGHGSHFSFLSTLPLSFPYDFPPEQEGEEALGDRHQKELEQDDTDDSQLTPEQKKLKIEQAHKKRMQEVEHMLQRYEVQASKVATSATADGSASSTGLTGHVPPRRRHQHFPSARLLGVSPAALRDCLPHLDVGDAFQWIQSQNMSAGPSSYSSGPMADAASSDTVAPDVAARKTLSDFVSGRLIGARIKASPQELENNDNAGYGTKYMRLREKIIKGEQQEEPPADRTLRRLDELEQKRAAADATDYAPWSLCYAGHQFGVWAGQLGDGRAFTLMETKNPETNQRWEIQLKGAGRTPYSRFADGLATLSSSVREYLCSEAMAALGIPTSRALAVVALPELQVARERLNVAAITTRLCESWLRIGSFQIHSSRNEWESVRILGEYVSHDLFGFNDVVKGGDVGDDTQRPVWVQRMVEEVAKRNAKTIGLWQVYGFMHGVMNTDNIALTGHTIDYGPYAFMDLYDEGQICNHSDGEGRYAYRLQPTMGVFAIRELLNAVAPLVGFELEHKRAPAPGELLAASEAQIDEWRELCDAEYSKELEAVFTSTLLEQWKQAYRARLGLTKEEGDDKSALIDPLSGVLSDLDFSSTLRRLCQLPALLKARGVSADDEEKLKDVITTFVTGDASTGLEPWYDPSILPEYIRSQKETQARTWLSTYARRLLQEGRDGDQVTAEMKAKNPRFVLRNWVTNEVAKRLEDFNETEVLAKVLEMATQPFEDWGLPREGRSKEEVEEEARWCSLGRPLTGNLPSCSS
ncbi:Protein adenylyltransferase SelO, mitochondrial [Pseudozyma hubeiensis]|nr:Protein adenylyltransferase SelO, mitochondrial [Pseudozyma hubeiensis]